MVLANLQEQALLAFQALTMFVAFVTVLFGIRYTSLLATATDALPDASTSEKRKNEQKRRRKVLWVQGLPLVSLTGVSVFLFLPLAIRIVDHHQFRLWNFDLIIEAYVFLAAYMFIFFIWTLVLNIQIVIKAFNK